MLAVLMFLQSAAPEAAPFLPVGWLKACALGEATHCEVNRVTIADLIAVHIAVDTAIKPKPDKAGELESWHVFPAEGDYSDKVLSKRAALLALGMKPEALTIVIGQVYREGSWRTHAVLEVKLDGKTLVLDNLKSAAIYTPGGGDFPWRETSRQSFDSVMWTTSKE